MFLSVHEHEVIHRGSGPGITLPAALFDQLKRFYVDQVTDTFMPLNLTFVGGREVFKVGNFVGVISAPDLTLEILPKVHLSDQEGQEAERHLLLNMLLTVGLLPGTRSSVMSGVQTSKMPFHEVFFRQYLIGVSEVVRRGLIRHYSDHEDNLLALKGSLDVGRQIQQNSILRHRFAVRHQEYDTNRAENRLIQAALLHLVRHTGDAENARLARELLFAFEGVSPAGPLDQEFRQWITDRNSTHYQQVRDTTELILREQSPFATAGQTRFFSLLFPMQDVYEKYVLHLLRRQFSGWQVQAQVSSEHLATLQGRKIFQLRPDVLMKRGHREVLLDTKWKRLNANDRANHYGIAQADLYQMLAYAQTYLKDQQEKTVVLLYPRNRHFVEGLGPFVLSGQVKVWALPVNLQRPQGLHDLLDPVLIDSCPGGGPVLWAEGSE